MLRQVTRKKRADESGTPDDHILTGSATFQAEVFYVIIDSLVSMLRQRCNAYGELSGQFG